jgi:hypothetical protein
MNYVFNDEQHSAYVAEIMNELIKNKKALMPFINIEGFKEKMNTSFRSLGKIANGTYDGQEDTNYLYATLTDDYIIANYYTEMYTVEDAFGELAVCSYNMEALLFNLKTNEIYFFDRFHSNGEVTLEQEEGNFIPDAKTSHTEYGLTKYYLENNAPKVFKKNWSFDYKKMRNIALFNILDKIINNTSSDSIANLLNEINQMKCLKS